MKQNILITLFIFLSFKVIAQRQQTSRQQQSQQQQVTVRGTIIDRADNIALPGAHVSLIHMRDSSRVFSGITNQQGVFIKCTTGQLFTEGDLYGLRTGRA
jgi:hypothetical protein